MRADYHPLRLRRILPAAGHLLDLEAAAAARGTERPDAGTRERFVRAVGRLLGVRRRSGLDGVLAPLRMPGPVESASMGPSRQPHLRRPVGRP